MGLNKDTLNKDAIPIQKILLLMGFCTGTNLTTSVTYYL